MKDIILKKYLSHDVFKEEVINLLSADKYNNLEASDIIKKLVGDASIVLDDGIFILRVLYKSYLIIYSEAVVCIYECERSELDIINLTVGVGRLTDSYSLTTKKALFRQILSLKCKLDSDGLMSIVRLVDKQIESISSILSVEFKSTYEFITEDENIRKSINKLSLTFKTSIHNLLIRLLMQSVIDNRVNDFIQDLCKFTSCIERQQGTLVETSVLFELELKYREKLVL